ncbi:hypothetical protein HY249_01760 [Candidatus Azambacteria bacterium]|nr:hypothetical protein [Candidatus Azambacteria bacterium]
MDQNTNPSQNTNAPSGLPVIGDKKIETHTMQQDLKQPGAPAPAIVSSAETIMPSEKPKIPEPPKPPIFQAGAEIKKPSPFDKFRKPQGVAPEIPDISKLKEMMPKIAAESAIPERKPATETVMPKKEMKPISPEIKKLAIEIPGEKSRAPMIVAFVTIIILVAGGAGFGYYWFFAKEKPQQKTTTEQPVKEQQPEVITVPPPVVQQPEAITTPVVEIPAPIVMPEPEAPRTDIAFAQTVITTSSQKNAIELIQNMKADSRSITGNGVITRHLFKLSNDAEKRFIIGKELLEALGVMLPNTVWSYISDVEFISYKLDSSIRYGVIAKSQNKEAVMTALRNWDIQAVTDMKPLFMGEPITMPEAPKFSENTYLDFLKRYINLKTPEISIDIAASDKYFIIATSKDMIFSSILLTQK